MQYNTPSSSLLSLECTGAYGGDVYHITFQVCEAVRITIPSDSRLVSHLRYPYADFYLV